MGAPATHRSYDSRRSHPYAEPDALSNAMIAQTNRTQAQNNPLLIDTFLVDPVLRRPSRGTKIIHRKVTRAAKIAHFQL